MEASYVAFIIIVGCRSSNSRRIKGFSTLELANKYWESLPINGVTDWTYDKTNSEAPVAVAIDAD